MTAAQFNSLTLEERTKLVWTRGNFLAMRQRHGCSVVLYHLQECFAEVWYHHLEDNTVLVVHAFEKPACLEPYLEQISIISLKAR